MTDKHALADVPRPKPRIRCLVCGRWLTDPESIKNGVGPICAKEEAKMG